MTNEYNPEQKATGPYDVVVAWLLAIAVIAGVALFAPEASVDLEAHSRELTALLRG